MPNASVSTAIAANPGVRAILVELQRELAGQHDLVTEGRDQGTVVFPHAECKIFLTASPEERARRLFTGDERFLLQRRDGQTRIDPELGLLLDDVETPDLVPAEQLYTLWAWFSGQGVRMGVFDTGIKGDHPDVKNIV